MTSTSAFRLLLAAVCVTALVASVVASAQSQRTCSWGKPAVSACSPATASTPASCGRGYVCDSKTNFCCAPPDTLNPSPQVPPMSLCPDGTPAVSSCFYGYCGPYANLVCTSNRLCCPVRPPNTGTGSKDGGTGSNDGGTGSKDAGR